MKNLEKYIEHTILKPDATKKEVEKILEEAVIHKFLGICINPCYVDFAKQYLNGADVKIVTVVGFPLGAMNPSAKALEARLAVEDGADEIDMVINIGALKDGNFDYVKQDIEFVKEACENKPLKVILETDLLTQDEIKKACQICVEAKADFVKTSTGFVKNGVGAKVEDVKLMFETVSPFGLQVKASAGIRDKQKALELIKAGATRLGTSAGVEIIGG